MFTDMVGFTSAAQRHEAQALDLLREQEGIVRAVVREHQGQEIKSTGDGLLIEFASGLWAAECAVEVQTRLHARNSAPDLVPIRLRIGIHIGDVEVRDSDIFGDAVNVAARVLSVAEPEGIAVTEQVAHLLRNRLAYPVESLGAKGLKGVDHPVPVLRVVLPWSPPLQITEERTYPRVAILPLRSISPDSKDEYFADGLTEELISTLGQVRELRVIARSSAARFRSTDRPLSDIGRELGASAVLQGSVRKAGDRLRISLQLVDVTSQENLWTQTFDRRLDDVFAVQAEVGKRTAAALRVRVFAAPHPALHKPPTTNLAAYGLYLQGLHLSRSHRTDDNPQAMDLFRRAIEMDPEFSLAYSHLANRLLGMIGEVEPIQQVLPKAGPLVEKALLLDPESPDAHMAKGNLAMQGDLDWAIAEAEFRQALALNPSDPEPRLWYGVLLRALQRYSDAEEQARVYMELDPLNIGGPSLLTSILRLAGNFEEAERVARTQLKPLLDPSEFHMTLAYTLVYSGRMEEARKEYEQVFAPDNSTVSLDRAVLLARLGKPAEARSLLESYANLAKEQYVPLNRLAVLAAAIGDKDRAIAYLEKDWAEGDRGLWFTYQGIGFDPIRSDPRFVRMLERMRLPTSAPFHRHGRAI
jgi:TolB-like protein/class 3 adenylate cyclase/Flp pilus assembly protein TadD